MTKLAIDGAGASAVTDHPFRVAPGAPSWDRCWHPGCHLGEAAHTETTVVRAPVDRLNYRCPDCVTARDFGKAMPHLPGACP